MAKRSAFMISVDARANQIVRERQHVHTQMCLDAAMIAENQVFSMGPTRCRDFAAAFSETLKTIAEIAVKDGKDDKELWHTKDTVDKELKRICGENFVPWEERYV